MENIKRIEEIAKKEVIEGGFEGIISIQQFDKEPCFLAGTDISDIKIVEIKYNPKYEQENPGKINDVIRDITRHEINHTGYKGFTGCPRSLENHVELIAEPIAMVLAKKGFSKDDIHYVANALEDTILNMDLNRKFLLDGITHVFADVGRHNENKFTDFYEAHIKLNLYLWGNKKEKKELAQYFNNSTKVKEVLQNFLKKTGISKLKEKINVDGKEVEVKDREKIRQFLTNEKNWPEIAKIYAEEFSKLMQPGYALPLLSHCGKGTKGRENEKDDEELEGNPFDKEMYKPESKKKRMKKAYENNERIPPWIDYFEALDLVYQNLAQKLNIKVRTFTKQTSMPIYYYGKKPFDPDKDKLKHVTFGFDDEGKVELKKKRWHENIPLEYKIHQKGFPETRFCMLDTSDSMRHDSEGGYNIGRTSIIPWGDNSKYHYALLAWYGLLEYLKQNHLLKQTKISLGNFSNETIIGEGLREAKKIALTPQFSNTYIDLDRVKKMFKEQGMLIFTISDGGIGNWNEIKNEFIRAVKQHYYFHFQIGPENETSRDLEKAGLYVEYIKNAKDLATKVIDLTDKLYRRK